MNTKKKLRQLVRRCGTNDPFRIARELGIETRYDAPSFLMGFHQYSNRVHIIHINPDMCYEWQRFTCAHELGHALLHPKTCTSYLSAHTFFSIERIENEANEFAAGLLAYGMEHVEGMTLQEAAAIYGVPPKYAEYLMKTVL